MAYRYNVHGSNAPLSMVTVDDDEDEDPSTSLFSNTFLYFTFYFTGPTKKHLYRNGFGGSRADRGSKKRLNISRNRLTLNFPF